MSKIKSDANDLAVIERYYQVVNYLYPIIQSMPRAHGKFRDRLLEALIATPGQMYSAAKSTQVSRVYLVDSSLAELRWLLRFAAHPKRKLITPHQQEVASIHLAEVGQMVGAWVARLRR
jgi:hypothetical protein